jgi:hypothetical protein
MRTVFVAVGLVLPWAALAQHLPGETTPSSGPELRLDGDDAEPVPLTQPATTSGDDRADRYRKSGLIASLPDRIGLQAHKVTLGGYGEVEFHKEAGRDSQFVHHRYVLFVYGRIHPRISTSTEFEIEFGGSPAKRDGVLGAGEALLEFSVVDFEIAPWLIARGGIILVPFGAYNLRHDSPTQDLTERPLALTTITPTTWFESGAGFHGKFDVGNHAFGYEAYMINGLDAKIGADHGMKGAVGSKGEDNNGDKALVGRFTWSPALALELGLSGYTGEYDDHGHRVRMGALDTTLRLGRFEVQGEAVLADIDPGFQEGFTPGSPANTRTAVPTGMRGGYLQTNIHFAPPSSWLPNDLSDAHCTGVLRYESTDTDTAATDAHDVHKLTFGLNFRPIEAFVWKNELQLVSNGAGGTVRHLASGDWQFEPKYVGSLAFLF